MPHLATGKLVVFSDKDLTKLESGYESGLKLGKDDKAQLLTLGSDGALPTKEAMENLFNSAIEQGVRLISGGGSKESAEALYLRSANKQVKLQDIISLAAEEMQEALRVCAMLENADPDQVEFSAKVELIERPVDTDKIKELREGVKEGLIKWSDYLLALDEADYIHLPADAKLEDFDLSIYQSDVVEQDRIRSDL